MPQELRPEVIPIPYQKFFFIAEYKTRPNEFVDLELSKYKRESKA
jgi:hypothetical protein